MPTYQYACTECGHAFEQFQSFSDDALTVCPQCEGRLRKVFNAVGVVFKGSGFYRNDSRAANGSGEKSPVKAESSESTSGDSGGSTGKAEGSGKSEPSGSDGSQGGSKGDTGTSKTAGTSGAAKKPEKSGSKGSSAA